MERATEIFQGNVRDSRSLDDEVRAVERKLRNLEGEQARLEKYQGILKKILALKTSPETLKKVHHNLQLESRLKWLTKRSGEAAKESIADPAFGPGTYYYQFLFSSNY